MTGEGSSCTESGLPGPTDGQPREEATWQGSDVKRSSLGFISKMLLGWQEHTCPHWSGHQKYQWPWEDSWGTGGDLLLQPWHPFSDLRGPLSA